MKIVFVQKEVYFLNIDIYFCVVEEDNNDNNNNIYLIIFYKNGYEKVGYG